jgi:hypothetical protein
MKKFFILLLLTTQASAVTPLVVSDWIATGSGCQGQMGKIQNIKMTYTQDEKNPFSHKITFSLPSYELSGEKPITPQRPTFSRECALRIALDPPKNTRIKNIYMESQFLVNKDKGVKAEMNYRLLTGSGLVATKKEVLEEDVEVKNKKIPLNLSMDNKGKKSLAAGSCSASKLVGIDFSLSNERQSFKEKVNIAQEKDQEVVLSVELEACE